MAQPLALATTLDGLSPILEPTEWKERTAAHKCPHVPPTCYTKCDQREGQSSPSFVWFVAPAALGVGTRVSTVQTHLRTGHSLTTRAQGSGRTWLSLGAPVRPGSDWLRES